MEFTKKDDNSVEITHKQQVFRADLISEKETLEARLVELNAILKCLK